MIGYKKCLYFDVDDSKEGYAYFKNALVTLEIPKDSTVVSPCMPWVHASGIMYKYHDSKKFRCSYAKVLDIVDVNEQTKHVDCAFSIYDFRKRFSYGRSDKPITVYIKGRKVVADSLDKDEFTECSNGIHFFLTKEEAIEYVI